MRVSRGLWSMRLQLNIGCPPLAYRTKAADILKQATSKLEIDATAFNPNGTCLSYGPVMGCEYFRVELSRFLTAQYGSTVKSSDLMLTCGATQGIHLVSTMLLQSAGAPVFVMDPAYGHAIDIFRQLKMNAVPVATDEHGILPDDFESKIAVHRRILESRGVQEGYYPALLYLETIITNPTGSILPEDRCKSIVEIARKHNILILCDDVYNITIFDDKIKPHRLFRYENGADDGCVISNGTFSKILAPGLRIGWLEISPKVRRELSNGAVPGITGAVNHYLSQVTAMALQQGCIEGHTESLRHYLKRSMKLSCDTVRQELPDVASFRDPSGGYHMWVELPDGVDTKGLVQWLRQTKDILIEAGPTFSPSGAFGNFIRISPANVAEENLQFALQKVCACIKDFMSNADRTQVNHL